jgi:uncharacterized membrane protein
MRKGEIAVIVIVLLSILVTVLTYSSMPERVASHWDINGNVNGHMSRFWGMMLFPIMFIVLGALFIVIPRIDPLKANIKKFQNHYDWFILVIMLFLLATQGQVLLWNLGVKISPNFFFPLGMGILVFAIGVLMQYAKRNYSIGIRTPWTLANDKVWNKTHALGSKLFKIAGIIALIGALIPKYAFYFVIFPLIAVALYSVIYSYIVYRKTKH